MNEFSFRRAIAALVLCVAGASAAEADTNDFLPLSPPEPNPAAPGQAVTLTATVVPQFLVVILPPAANPREVTPQLAACTTPTGTVTFASNGVAIPGPGNPAAVGAGGVATFTTTALAVGTDAIDASYSGDGSCTPQTSPTAQVVVGPSIPVPTLDDWARAGFIALLAFAGLGVLARRVRRIGAR